MDTEIITNLPETQPEELLTWHKPEVQRITVSLDTANGTGSGPDFGGHTSALS